MSAGWAFAAPTVQHQWLAFPDDWQPQWLGPERIAEHQAAEPGVALTGGTYWHVLSVVNPTPADVVLDFRNSSVVGHFVHWVFAADGRRVHRVEGGIQSVVNNPFFLRHGRELTLPAGEYQVITRLSSPFYLAQPEPDVFMLDAYRQSIKLGTTVTLLGMGIFFALGIYYVVVGISRARAPDLLYAGFILGNVLYNGTALLVFRDLLGSTQFYLISFPILLSNMAYIGFVMTLLGINRQSSKRLYSLGLSILGLFALFFVASQFRPDLSLEFCRYGVAVFGLYGFTAAVVRIRQGNRTARYYLVANLAFIIPGLISIQASTLAIADTLLIEHIGLFAVALEVILLSLVVSHQIGMVYREKEESLAATQNAIAAAKEALATKQRFLANVSHELRTPLNAIQGSVELMGRHALPKAVYQHIDTIDASSRLLLVLINDILDLAKMSAQQLRLVEEDFDLDTVIGDVVSIYRNAYAQDRIRLLIDVDPGVPSTIRGDANRLKQVLANLLSNALKFTEQGDVQLSVERASDTTLTFTVADTGIGIAPEKLSTVFAAFTQADASTARKYGGTGLGLQIASKLVNLMGGELSVASTLGEGSTFRFTLPLPVVQDAPPNPSHPTHRADIESELPLSVLAVDDNPVNLEVLLSMLEGLGVRYQGFSDPEAAIAHLMAQTYDIVLMDVQMPSLDGLEATAMLRRQGYSKPIIAFTANASETDQRVCLDTGMDDVLVKPIRLEELRLKLMQWAHPNDEPE